jgi:hypothetical protein
VSAEYAEEYIHIYIYVCVCNADRASLYAAIRANLSERNDIIFSNEASARGGTVAIERTVDSRSRLQIPPTAADSISARS